MQTDKLWDKIYGALAGLAIGDAMGAPVEMMSFEEIESAYGFVKEFLPYKEEQIGCHGSFSLRAGSYTDDTRMVKLLSQAALKDRGRLDSNTVGMALINGYFQAGSQIEKEFLEEYFYKAALRQDKQIFGGQPTNGGIMCCAPWGILSACAPGQAFDQCFEALFFVEGYARYSAPIAAAAIAQAFCPDAAVGECIEAGLEAIADHKRRREGSQWQNWSSYPQVASKNEELLRRALAIAKEDTAERDFYRRLREATAQPFFADGAETLAVSMAFASRAKDFRHGILLAVNYGRDCDSSAAVTGALLGALWGVSAIPRPWIQKVEECNPAPGLRQLADGFYEILVQRIRVIRRQLERLTRLEEKG